MWAKDEQHGAATTQRRECALAFGAFALGMCFMLTIVALATSHAVPVLVRAPAALACTVATGLAAHACGLACNRWLILYRAAARQHV